MYDAACITLRPARDGLGHDGNFFDVRSYFRKTFSCKSTLFPLEMFRKSAHFSYSEDSKASSTATTPMESSRKIKFNHDGNTPPGHQTGASWEAYARKKRNREDEDDGSGGIDA